MIDNIKKYYKRAANTSLLALDNLTGKWYHIFSIIELLPEDIPDYNIPTDVWKENTVRAKNSSKANNYSFYLTISPIKTVKEALRIFDNPKTTKISDYKINFFNDEFVSEPAGSYPLIFGSNIYSKDGLEAILPKRNSGMYVWTRIDYLRVVQKTFESSFVTEDMKAMSQLTLDWLGFDIWEKPEHIGNVYLSAPNPYFRSIDISLSRNPTGFFYTIYPRKGIKEKFIFRVTDKHGDAIALDQTFKVPDYTGLIELPHEPNLFQLTVYDNKGGLIATREPAAFLKSIQINMSVKQADLHVVEKSNEQERTVAIIEKYSAEQPSVIGKPKDFNAEYYFKIAEDQRKHVDQKNSKEFIFFSGGKTEADKLKLKVEAKEAIRDIINRSRETCYLCDPYFNSKDLVDYAFYIKASGVTIRILNSKESIKKDEAKNITNVLKEYNSKPFGKIEVRTLRGDSILHDRLIIADKTVWLIGSSFNEFGNRATTIAKVPEPSNIQIIKEVEKWFFNDEFSETIDSYANE